MVFIQNFTATHAITNTNTVKFICDKHFMHDYQQSIL